MDIVLKKNFTYLFLLQNANYIIPLILLPYLTKTLGADNFGKISFVQAFITYFILLTDYGFNISTTKEIVRIRGDKDAVSRVFWSTTFTKLLLAFGSFLIIVTLLFSVQKLNQMTPLVLTASVGVLSTLFFPIWLFQGLEKMAYITWLNIIPRIIILFTTLLIVKKQSDYLTALQLQVGGTLLGALSCSFLIWHEKIVNFKLPNFKDIKNNITDGWHIFSSGVATNIYTTTNTVVLGFLTNDSYVGFFAAAEKIIRAIISLFSSVSQVTFPRINAYYLESKQKALDFGGKLLFYSALITFAGGLLLLVTAPMMVKILFGLPQYQETISIIRISSFLPFFAICNGILAVNILITFGLKKEMLKVVATGGLFSILFIVPFVTFFQAKGVAICALLTEIIITILLLYQLQKHKLFLMTFNHDVPS
jgi:polysaccharide transporter, PST family